MAAADEPAALVGVADVALQVGVAAILVGVV
jgi:hypothetical protein